jgi:hypothetical protein
MKCIYFSFFIFAFISCKKSTTTPVPTDNYVSFTTNSLNYTFKGMYDYFNISGVTYGFYSTDSNKMQLVFYTRHQASLQIIVSGTLQLNTKMRMRGDSLSSISFDGDPVYTTTYFDTTTSYVIFTRFDNKAAIGTFQCSGTDPNGHMLNVTNGKFYLYN